MPHIYFIGVDVGTSSARAALVNSKGQVVVTHVKEIKIWNPKPNHFEQSSNDIWNAVCECVKTVARKAPKHEIVGIGFDATCSLVVLDEEFNPLSVSTTGNDEQNVILWMDHRAEKETDFINSTKHDILKYVCNKISLEMEIPKLLWIKRNLRLSTWNDIGHLFDLPDFLTWKATNSLSRSLCSVVCKWNYDSMNMEWSQDFLEKIGMPELCDDNFSKLGNIILEPGEAIASGLSEEAANELGLHPGIAVGASLIDAHAGALALLGCDGDDIDDSLVSKMGIISGTSSCHMSVTENVIWPSGFWGPYKNAIYPDMYLLEAGQSATGILVQHILKTHPAYQIALNNAGERSIYSYLNGRLFEIAHQKKVHDLQQLTKDFHVWPDFHGNRTPINDPKLKGMISGLSMTLDEDNLAITYLAFIQSIAYGTRHIIESLEKSNRPPFKSILICGGMSKNSLFVQTHADVCTVPVLLPEEPEMVLVGASILGACAARVFPDLQSAAKSLGSTTKTVTPNSMLQGYHNKKYKVFLKMLSDQQEYRDIMGEQTSLVNEVL